MIVRVQEPNKGHRELIKNLITFYRYDLMPFVKTGDVGSSVNIHGVIDNGEGFRSPAEALKMWDIFWEKLNVLFPMLIEADDSPAGFALVVAKPHCHPTVDFRMNDFFVLNKFRRLGVARNAVFQIFDRFPGIWEITWLPENHAAAGCWRALISEYTRGKYEAWDVDAGMDGLKFTAKK